MVPEDDITGLTTEQKEVVQQILKEAPSFAKKEDDVIFD